MKRIYCCFLIACMLGIVLLTNGCGNTKESMDTAASGGSSYQSASYAGNADMGEAAAVDAMANDDADYDLADNGIEEQQMSASASEEGVLSGNTTNTISQKSEKLIYTYNYSVETKEFQPLLETVTTKTTQLGGYVESSETHGNASDGLYRYANMTLRIPSDKMPQLLSILDTDANVTYSSCSTDNVTLQYVDMQSHVKALRTEQKTLLELIEKAKKLEDIIKLQSQLTKVRYEIESYESQLRMYDNLVDYSTLHLDITEVDRATSITSSQTSFGEEIQNRFSDNLYAVGQWLRGFVIWLIGSLPILVPIILGIVIIIVFLCKRRNRRKKDLLANEHNVDGMDVDS